MRRRHDDPRDTVDPDDVERFFASLPRVIDGLRRGKWQNRAIAVFTLVAFLLVAWRTEIQQDRLDQAAQRDRQTAFEQCQVANDNARHLNDFLDQIITSVRTSKTLTSAEKAQRVRVYAGIKQGLPVCRKP